MASGENACVNGTDASAHKHPRPGLASVCECLAQCLGCLPGREGRGCCVGPRNARAVGETVTGDGPVGDGILCELPQLKLHGVVSALKEDRRKPLSGLAAVAVDVDLILIAVHVVSY